VFGTALLGRRRRAISASDYCPNTRNHDARKWVFPTLIMACSLDEDVPVCMAGTSPTTSRVLSARSVKAADISDIGQHDQFNTIVLGWLKSKGRLLGSTA
jgi:hypothetical protein